MNFNLPHTIENGLGEKIVFQEIIPEHGVEKLIVKGYCAPGGGPAMHVHYLQDEGFTVVKGNLSYEIQGKKPVQVSVGQSVVFPRGVPHRFWNDGKEELEIQGWLQPANNVVFFLSTLYAAQKKAGSDRPELFDAAFLSTQYKSEFEATSIPLFVRKVIMPLTYIIGKLSGKYKKFKNAPAPFKK